MKVPHTNQPELLTPEQIESIEANNRLLSTFSAQLEKLTASNPDAHIPSQLMFASFLLGADTVNQANARLNQQLATEIHEIRSVIYTYSQHSGQAEGDS